MKNRKNNNKNKNKNKNKGRSQTKRKEVTKIIVQKAPNNMPYRPQPAMFSECVQKYIKAIIDPWSSEALGACVPKYPSRPSDKRTVCATVQAVVGTQGYGFIALSPTTANNLTAAVYSTINYTGNLTAISWVNQADITAARTATVQFPNLPFTAAQLQETVVGTTVASRIVSISASAQYTGTVSNMGGMYYSLVEPSHNNLNVLTFSDMNTFPEIKRQRVTDQKAWITLYGVDEDELSYSNQIVASTTGLGTYGGLYPFSNSMEIDVTMGTTGATPGVIVFTGVPGNTFNIDIIMHCEFVGRLASSSATPNATDITGLSKAQDIFGQMSSAMAEQPTFDLKKAYNNVLRAISVGHKISAAYNNYRNPGRRQGGLALQN
jgi:hypothetical protein